MEFVSTRDREGKGYSFTKAALKGLAPDRGLFVPKSIPALSSEYTQEKGLGYEAYTILKPFFESDESEGDLLDITRKAFSFPLSMHADGGKDTLELYYGPTCSFKDFGARFLAFLLDSVLKKSGEKKTILVATSGDTGSAVASAFSECENISVKLLFPKDGVSERQKKQLTCWKGTSVSSYEVDGTFDDCQKMVKDAFMDPEYSSSLSSANSINIGRLMAQMVYYFHASFLYEAKYGEKPIIIVPSGNVGNVTAAYYAKEMGAPIRRLIIATNANRSVEDYISSGKFTPRASIRTLANAMDVGNPSNLERLFDLFPTYEVFKQNVKAYYAMDDKIEDTIRRVYDETGYVICPHTACGEFVRRMWFRDEPTIVVSTAHPAKFDKIVEPLIGRKIAIPESLYGMIRSDSDYKEIGKDYHELFN